MADSWAGAGMIVSKYLKIKQSTPSKEQNKLANILNWMNVWDVAKAVLRGKFIVLGASLEKKKSQNNITVYLKKLEKGKTK